MATERSPGVTATAIPTGGAVYTVDGGEFARVKSVRGGYFELDASKSTFWLSNAYVAEVRGTEVHLGIGASEVEAHRLDAPGIQTRESQTSRDRVIGDDQALTQRERMERELAAQRERMGIKREATIEDAGDMQSEGTRETSQPSAEEEEEIEDAAKDAEREAQRAQAFRTRDSEMGGRLPQ